MQCITTNVHSAVLAWTRANTVTARKRDSDRQHASWQWCERTRRVTRWSWC
ncbi:hypothetical protein [Coprococcus sp. AF19-8AC]|uniref:hypothetical protein n=1 Tax=Coprococcus sp. AF19-8AC TaxID=2293090 RepID=UPI0014031A13|nr:hypothetical protein [Coprococcus sp. AF19-8AC]